MKILTGILSKYYKEKFQQTAKELDIELIILAPNKLEFVFSATPEIYYEGKLLPEVDAFFVRGTNVNYKQYTYLAQILNHRGVIMLDSIDRFTGYPPTKEMSSLKRALQNTGPKTYCFTTQHFTEESFVPLFAKPVDGKHNKGLITLDTFEAYLKFIADKEKETYIIQENLDIVVEYRYLIYVHPNSKLSILGINVKKTIGKKGKIKADEIPELPKIVKQAIQMALFRLNLNYGLYGVDVAVTEDKRIQIIETNYSPEWERMDKILGINVAKIVLNLLEKRWKKE